MKIDKERGVIELTDLQRGYLADNKQVPVEWSLTELDDLVAIAYGALERAAKIIARPSHPIHYQATIMTGETMRLAADGLLDGIYEVFESDIVISAEEFLKRETTE